MSTILQDIEAQISGAKTAVARQNVGIVREIGDGVAKIEGLTDAMLNEMLDFGNGVTGLALNLEETEVGAIILGDYTSIREGATGCGGGSRAYDCGVAQGDRRVGGEGDFAGDRQDSDDGRSEAVG